MALREYLDSYIPVNSQEENDLKVMKDFYSTYKNNSLSRENKIAHFSASCWIANKDFTKILMGYHLIYDNWGWLGGHADGMDDLLLRATLEAQEESGLKTVKPYFDYPISVEILPVTYHYKKGNFVNSHLHLNFTFLFTADENELLLYNPNEHNGLKWVNIGDVLSSTNEECMKPIYKKLNDFILNNINNI